MSDHHKPLGQRDDSRNANHQAECNADQNYDSLSHLVLLKVQLNSSGKVLIRPAVINIGSRRTFWRSGEWHNLLLDTKNVDKQGLSTFFVDKPGFL